MNAFYEKYYMANSVTALIKVHADNNTSVGMFCGVNLPHVIIYWQARNALSCETVVRQCQKAVMDNILHEDVLRDYKILMNL